MYAIIYTKSHIGISVEEEDKLTAARIVLEKIAAVCA